MSIDLAKTLEESAEREAPRGGKRTAKARQGAKARSHSAELDQDAEGDDDPARRGGLQDGLQAVRSAVNGDGGRQGGERQKLPVGQDLVLNARKVAAGAVAREIRAERHADLARLRELREGGKDAQRAQLVRIQRWARQSAARVLLEDARVAKCLRVRVQPWVSVLYAKRYKRAHYAGLMTCGSVWDCPLCAARITERRRVEIESVAVTRPELSAFMGSLTLEHHRGEPLKLLDAYIAEAATDMKNWRSWHRFIKRWGILAYVTSREVTYGLVNGWHDHRHILFWSTLAVSEIDAKAIRAELSAMFEQALAKRGRYAHPLHGVDVRTADDAAAAYVAKWGHEPEHPTWSLAAELTKGSAKISLRKGEHYAPFQLLDIYLMGDAKSGAYAGALFREYASAMFGQSQLHWSHGGRKALGLNAIEPTDEELAGAGDEDATRFAELSADDWRSILRGDRKAHHRAMVLEIASRGNYNDLVIYMRAIGAENFGKGGDARVASDGAGLT